MSVSTSPGPAPPRLAIPPTDILPLRAVVTRTLPETGLYDADMVRFFTDLGREFGVAIDPPDLRGRSRCTFIDLVDAVRGDLQAEEGAFSTVVLAHTVPDSEPRFPACHLTETLPGRPLCFAVADQGRTAGFTALGLCALIARDHDAPRSAVVMLDQNTVVSAPQGRAGHDLPTENRVVALVFDRTRPADRLVNEVRSDVGAEAAATALAHVAQAGGNVIVGAGLARAADTVRASAGRDGRIAIVGPGRPSTGVWSELLLERDRLRGNGVGQVTLLDHDEDARTLGVTTVQLTAGGDAS